jgi:Tol biopolymer transport system component/tRNA A-37 threonylcarbamoyl transferase component Bud32
MPLETGTRVGPYEVTAQLGAGGMGEVCRARDTKLNREVALKVLPSAFATDPDRMTRFQREAQLLASLNHPNIAAIYGLEDSGSPRAIVMELVEGPTLADLIVGRSSVGGSQDPPLPLAEALKMARQIADAIEYAHDRGIIHRDLKPANIKVTPDGTVKVLDFGLAKAMDEAGDAPAHLHGSMSPTLSLGATHAGVIMGTAAYMAPEQAKGKSADRRSDVWAFGVVLYEMLTGARMFGGDTIAETLASVIKDPITFAKVPGDTPIPIRRLVTRCLERDPRRRLQSIAEARIILEDVIAGTTGESEPRPATVSNPINRWPWAVAGIAVLTAIAAIGWTWTRPAPAPPAVMRFTMSPPVGTTITNAGPNASQFAISPDGRYVVIVADETGRQRTIWVRALDSLSAQRLDRTEGASFPFWSPDSQHIAYFANGKLMRISMAGGAPLTICDAPAGEGGAWFQSEGQDGVIVFAPTPDGPLQRVLAQGGVPTAATTLVEGETGHSFPQFLPDGRFLYLARGNKSAIYVQSPGNERTFVVNAAGRAAFSPPALLLYLRGDTLLAHRWNLDTLRLEGEPVSIAQSVRAGGNNGRNAFAISANGVLAYRGGNAADNKLTWYARDGKAENVLLQAGDYVTLELSPNENRLVVVRGTGTDLDLWLKDLTTGVFSRLTAAPGPEQDPVWSPDSRRVAYVHQDDTGTALYETLIGSGQFTAVPNGSGHNFLLQDWTGDGKHLVVRRGTASADIRLVPVEKADASKDARSQPQGILEEPYFINHVRVSPDGKWVVYTSFESGQPEVSVASFPGFTDRRQISTGGGGAGQPRWRADGKELFFMGRNQALMAVDTTLGATLEIGPVRTLFQTIVNPSALIYTYAATRDGKRFLVREPNRDKGAVEQLYIVTNWTSLVRN